MNCSPIFALVLLAGCGASARSIEPQGSSPMHTRIATDAVLYVDGRVHTLVDGEARASGFRVESGRITHVWTGEVPAGLEGRRVDLAGATVLPGLVDAHFHLRDVGAAASELDLRAATSAEDAAALVAAAASRIPAGQPIVGSGWDQNDWATHEMPTHEVLDRAAPDHPVVLSRIDGHAIWVNARALELAHVDRRTADPSGGEILRDRRGNPTGVLVDGAIDLVASQLPEATPEQIRSELLAGLERCRRVGLTAVHDMGTSAAELTVLRELEREGLLTLRVTSYVRVDDFESISSSPPDREGLLQVVGAKLFADGALGSRGAALLEPYADREETRGLLVTPEETLREQAALVHARGYQLAIHAIGDRGNRVALDAIEAAQHGDTSRRHRIEHAQVIAAADIPRFAQLGVVASMQPTHATSDMPWAEARLGAQRIAGAYAWRTLLDASATLVFGSDAPVESENPWLGVYAAVTRTDREGMPEGGWRPYERLGVGEVLTRFTHWPAEVAGLAQEASPDEPGHDDLGRIREGAQADFVVIDRDPFEIAASDLDDVQTLRTIVGGTQVYEAH